MTDTSKDAFAKSTAPKTPADNIRDKDNAQLVPKPPAGARGAPNLAPPGAVGIRRNLVPKSQGQTKVQQPKKTPDKGHDFDR